jgi:RND family efflux transporter MFP subunit
MKRSLLIIGLCLLALNSHGQERTIHVTAVSLKELITYPEFSVPATTLSLNDSHISAETSGRILKIPVLVGDRVEKGKPLANIDCRNNKARLQQAKASLNAAKAQKLLAQRQIKRTQSLRAAKNVSEELHNQRQANLDSTKADQQASQARLQEAELEVERCQIAAPFTGIVMQRLKAEGEWVTPGQPVVQLLDSERLEVSAQVPVSIVASLNNTSNFTLQTNSGDYPLNLRHLLPVIKERGRNREARFQFSKTAALPGSTGRLLWKSSQAHLPADIPVRRKQQLGVFLLSKGKARFHPLPQALEGQPTPINLPLDSRVVIEGRHSLNDLDSVTVKSKSK